MVQAQINLLLGLKEVFAYYVIKNHNISYMANLNFTVTNMKCDSYHAVSASESHSFYLFSSILTLFMDIFQYIRTQGGRNNILAAWFRSWFSWDLCNEHFSGRPLCPNEPAGGPGQVWFVAI